MVSSFSGISWSLTAVKYALAEDACPGLWANEQSSSRNTASAPRRRGRLFIADASFQKPAPRHFRQDAGPIIVSSSVYHKRGLLTIQNSRGIRSFLFPMPRSRSPGDFPLAQWKKYGIIG